MIPNRFLSIVNFYCKKIFSFPENAFTFVKENGVKLGEMNKKLLQKVEELTLYVIEQQKEIEALKKEMKTINKL